MLQTVCEGQRFDRMTPDRAGQGIMEFIARVPPSTKDAMRPLMTVSRQRDPFAGAIYSAWKPGQITRYAQTIAEPPGKPVLRR